MHQEKEKHDEQVLFRTTKELKKQIEADAKANRISTSEWMRRAVVYYLKAQSGETKEENKKMLMACLDDKAFLDEFLQKLNLGGK